MGTFRSTLASQLAHEHSPSFLESGAESMSVPLVSRGMVECAVSGSSSSARVAVEASEPSVTE